MKPSFSRLLSVVACIAALASVISFAQQGQSKEDEAKYKLTPTLSIEFETGVYVPKDLEDSFKELDKMLTKELREDIRKGKESELFRFHHGFGTWLRNNWGLWKGLRLAKWFNGKGVFHPDDMSSIVLKSYWRRLNDKPLELEEQVKYYADYWKKAKEGAVKEEARVVVAKAKIREMMLNLAFRPGKAPEVEFGFKVSSDLDVNHAAKYRDGALILSERYLPEQKLYEGEVYFLDPRKQELYPVQLPEMDLVEQAAVLRRGVVFLGKSKGKVVMVEISGSRRTTLPVPVEGKFKLGIDQTRDAVLAVSKSYAGRWQDGKWNALNIGSLTLPETDKPPQIVGDRLYVHENNRPGFRESLVWVDLKAPKLTDFHSSTGVVGPGGPRWERISNYAVNRNGSMWVVSSHMGAETLLTQTPKGWRIAILNDGLKYMDDFFDKADSPDDRVFHSLSVTGVELQADASVRAVGARGLFTVTDKAMTPILWFSGTASDWSPTTLVSLGKDQYFVGCTYGGAVLLHRKGGTMAVTDLAKKIGKPRVF